jgi:hypothetical protein
MICGAAGRDCGAGSISPMPGASVATGVLCSDGGGAGVVPGTGEMTADGPPGGDTTGPGPWAIAEQLMAIGGIVAACTRVTRWRAESQAMSNGPWSTSSRAPIDCHDVPVH